MDLIVKQVQLDRKYDRKYKKVVTELLMATLVEYHTMNEKVPLRGKRKIEEDFHLNYPLYPQIIFLAFVDDEVIGFSIIGYADNCNPLADIFICELYIKPEYRRKGYGKEFANIVIQKSRGVCLYILNGNTVAEKFWHSVFNGWKWLRTPENEPDEEVKAYLITK